MTNPSDEGERAKKAIFDAMAPRRQKHILKKGYDNWDPFQEPKDPIDIRRDPSRRTTQQLVREFLGGLGHDVSPAYRQGALEVALGIINDEDRAKGAYEFSVWYRALLEREGLLR
ncbi:MAG: hypothetical protein ACLFOY_01375 [Desulfatibacillaceae bacterium]